MKHDHLPPNLRISESFVLKFPTVLSESFVLKFPTVYCLKFP
jgi:hypothetical protein